MRILLGVLSGFSIGFILSLLGYLRNRSFRRLLHEEAANGAPVTIAVVIASRNEEAVIESTVRSLLADAPSGARMIVVDDSTDSTFSILERLAEEFPSMLVLSGSGGSGKPAALNAALAHVHEDVVLFLDADTKLSWKEIERYRTAFFDPDVPSVYADFGASNRKRSPVVIFQDVLFSFGKAFVHSGLFAWSPFMTNGLFVRREVFDRVGPFDPESLVDDFDLFLRMKQAGLVCRFVLGPRCQIQYTGSMRELFHQMCRWYTGVIRELIQDLAHGHSSSLFVLVGVGALLFFPYPVMALGFGLSVPFLYGGLLPAHLALLYGASLGGYLFHDVRGFKEGFLNAFVGIPTIYLVFQIVFLTSLVKSFGRKRHWYKVSREKA